MTSNDKVTIFEWINPEKQSDLHLFSLRLSF